MLWSAAVWGAECRWWEEVLRSPCQCPRMYHSRRLQRVEAWAGDYERKMRETHTHVSSTALLSCSLTADVAAAQTLLAHSGKESERAMERVREPERALIWNTGSTNAALSTCPTRKRGEREKWMERYLILHEQRRQGLFPLQWRSDVPTHTRAFISLTAAGCYIHLQRSLTVSTTTLSFFHSVLLLYLSFTQQVWMWLHCR